MAAVIRDTSMKIVNCWNVISCNSFEIITTKPFLALSIEYNVMKPNIAMDADVNPVIMRNVSCLTLQNIEDARIVDWEELNPGNKQTRRDARNPEDVAFANSFLFISGNVVDCGGIFGL